MTTVVSKINTVDDSTARVHVAHGVVSIGMTVGSIHRSATFYCDVLGFEHVSEREFAGPEIERLTGAPASRGRTIRLRLGHEILELTEYRTPKGKPFPSDTRSNDHWFQHVAIVVRNMDEARARLCRFNVRHASIAPQRLPDWNLAAGGIRAFYFRDPDGHFLELLQFPPDKGNRKWHESADSLFLGIDHTAIVIRSTETSLRFYCGRLGMRVAGSSENHGPEQERLNNVAGAHLRISTLRASAGPGVELLEYLAPQTGRPRPADARPHDHLHWQTTVAVDGLQRSRIVSDPDGHVIELTRLA